METIATPTENAAVAEAIEPTQACAISTIQSYLKEPSLTNEHLHAPEPKSTIQRGGSRLRLVSQAGSDDWSDDGAESFDEPEGAKGVADVLVIGSY